MPKNYGINVFDYEGPQLFTHTENEIGVLHTLTTLMSSKPTSCFACEPPFSVSNAGQLTSFSIEALYTSIGGSYQ